MPPTQQYPVTSGTAGFYPGTSPAEYSAYGKDCCPKPTTTKHNHRYGGLSLKKNKISEIFHLKQLVQVNTHLYNSLPIRYYCVCCGFAWLVGVLNVFFFFLVQSAICGEPPVACGLA